MLNEIGVKYSEIKIYIYKLSLQHHVNDFSIKLNRTNPLFFKIRNSVSLIEIPKFISRICCLAAVV